jgi:hypothetical protein
MVSLAEDLMLALDRVSFARALGLEPDPWQEDFLHSMILCLAPALRQSQELFG